jgi:hypothetical protein
MVRYDSSVIYQFAERLEFKARLTLWLFSFLGGCLGAMLLDVISGRVGAHPSGIDWLGFVAGGLAGLVVGWECAFRIRLALHAMLCQVQIEENTRPAPVLDSPTADPLERRPAFARY